MVPDREGRGEPVPLGEVLEFMRLIWALDHGLQKVSKRMGAELGVTGPQRFVLRILGRRPAIAAGTLASVLKIHPSTLTGVLKRLEGRNLVKRVSDPEDSRRTMLSLTASGRRLDVPSPLSNEAAAADVLSRFGERKIRATEEVLVALAGALEAMACEGADVAPSKRRGGGRSVRRRRTPPRAGQA